MIRLEPILGGCVLFAAFLFADGLYDFGTNVLRSLKWNRLADLRDRLKPRVLPAARVLLVSMAPACVAAAVLL